MIKKPSRKISGKFHGVIAYSLFIFGLTIIPIVAMIPKKIRMKIFLRRYKMVGSEIR